jgi:pimeloyl-ACP methyl ester carboxylesterase
MMVKKQIVRVPVRGGDLVVARWPNTGPVIVLVHGISSSHMAWGPIADGLSSLGFDVIAPDLRGRGGSNRLEGAYGLSAHQEDLCRVIEQLSQKPVFLAGHSMGAYIGVEFGAHFSDYLERLILVDGGIALPRPSDTDPVEHLRKTLGPAVDRLSLEFKSLEDYLDFWRKHPAFLDPTNWNEYVESFFAYDLEEISGCYKSRVVKEAVFADGKGLMAPSMVSMINQVRAPMLLMTAERGVLNQPKPMLPVYAVQEKSIEIQHLTWIEVSATNHYSITLSRGIAPVMKAIEEFCRIAN